MRDAVQPQPERSASGRSSSFVPTTTAHAGPGMRYSWTSSLTRFASCRSWGPCRPDRLLEIDGRRPIFESVADECALRRGTALRAPREFRAAWGDRLRAGIPGDHGQRRPRRREARCAVRDLDGRDPRRSRLGRTPSRVAVPGHRLRLRTDRWGRDLAGSLGWPTGQRQYSTCRTPSSRSEIENDASLSGPRYGIDSAESVAAMGLLAETEGVLLDPVYTAKGMAGMLGQIRRGRHQPHRHRLLRAYRRAAGDIRRPG